MELSSPKIKKILMFQEKQLSSSNSNKFLIFREMELFYILGNRNPPLLPPQKNPYITGNGYPKKLFMFPEMELLYISGGTSKAPKTILMVYRNIKSFLFQLLDIFYYI